MGLSSFGLTGLDYVLLVITLVSAVYGLVRGFFKEVISLVSFILGIYLAIKFSDEVSNLFAKVITNEFYRYILAVFLIFIGVIFIGFLCNKIMHAIMTFTGFGFFDHLLGGVFGVARGLLFGLLIVFLVDISPLNEMSWAKNSKLTPYFKPLVEKLLKYVPADLTDFKNSAEKIKATYSENSPAQNSLLSELR